MKKFLLILLCIICFSGCASESNNSNGKITYVEAKEQIINHGAVLIDVRTEDEYNQKHIDGATLLTLDNINEDSVSNIVSNKDIPIIVYCQSGNRSNQAYVKLINLGYTEVYDLGAISNWEE